MRMYYVHGFDTLLHHLQVDAVLVPYKGKEVIDKVLDPDPALLETLCHDPTDPQFLKPKQLRRRRKRLPREKV